MQYQDAYGNDALHAAAHNGKAVPLICALIKEGVDCTAQNCADQTPAGAAREAGHALQAALLERAAEDKRKRNLKQQQQNSDNKAAVRVVHAVSMAVSLIGRCSGRRHYRYSLLTAFTGMRTLYVRLAFLTLTVTILPTLIAEVISFLRGDHEH